MMFNSITKKLKGDQTVQKQNKDLEGFICPICMASFVSPEMVQQHFDEKHPEDNVKQPENDTMFSPTTQRKESIRDIQENLNDLRQSLDEEVWFNKELKKEVERLGEELQEKKTEILSRDRVIEDYMRQMPDVEAARDTLNVELIKMNAINASLIAENKTIRSDFRICEEKMTQLENSRSEQLQIIELLKNDKSKIFDELSTLRSQALGDNDLIPGLTEQLAEATTNALLNEKRVVDLSEEIRTLKAAQSGTLLDLETKCSHLTEYIEDQKTEKTALIRSNEELVTKYQQQLHSLTIECGDLKNKVDALKLEVNELEDRFNQTKRSSDLNETQLRDANSRLKDTLEEIQMVKSQNKESVQRIKTQEVELLQIRNACINKDEEIKTLHKSVKSSCEKFDNLEQMLDIERKAKDDLRSQVEMTDAANVVMEQLEHEKKNLQEYVNTLKKQMEEEIDRMNGELSESRLVTQAQKEEILNLTSLVSEKEEKVKESEKNTHYVSIVCEKYQQKVNEEISSRSGLEDKLLALTRNSKSKEDSLNTAIESHLSSMKELEISLRNCEQERESAKSNAANLMKQLEIVNIKASKAKDLQKEVDHFNLKNEQLIKDFGIMAEEKDGLMTANGKLKNNINEFMKKIETNEEHIKLLETQVKNELKTLESKEELIISKDSLILELQTKINDLSERNNCLDDELLRSRDSIASLQHDLTKTNENILHLQQFIEKSEIEITQLSTEKASLESEIVTLKNHISEQQQSLSLLQHDFETLKNSNSEKQNVIENLQETLDSISKEKENVQIELTLANTEIDETRQLYSESLQQQKIIENEIKAVSVQLNESNSNFALLEEDYKTLQLKYSDEEERVKKEMTQLKNHIQALETTLNESSENYKQERLESTERELTLKSHCEDLELNIVNFKKSIQRTEEDLEGEKCLRQTERNNMMEKISQLTNQVTETDTLKNEMYQRLEYVETENIEGKIRLEAVVEEKEKVLEKIIQMENGIKKQNEGFTKKCREFDQLQSAILDLGRENQSLQITKEKITSRLWIVDDEVLECHNCHKSFSLTNRKHHCRNCGQVFCQDCSAKTATLAVSRKPVRVCDVCHLEVHSHRRNSSTRSSNISLSLQN